MNLDESVDAGSQPADAGSNAVPVESVAPLFSDSDLIALLVIVSVSLLCVLVAWLFGGRTPKPTDQSNKHRLGALINVLVAVFIIAIVTLVLVSPNV
jgi:uncharacterized Tic20 family protein